MINSTSLPKNLQRLLDEGYKEIGITTSDQNWTFMQNDYSGVIYDRVRDLIVKTYKLERR